MTTTNVKFLDLGANIDPIREEITEEINKVIKNTAFINGEQVETFTNNFANYIGTKYCVGVGNGTDALEIALQSLNLNKGNSTGNARNAGNNEVITQANTFVSTCFGVVNNNYSLKLVDIDPETYMMDLDKLEKAITEKTRAIIIVHLTGSCPNMDRLLEIIEKHNETREKENKIYLIEDTAQAHGAKYNGKRLGSFGDISCFSFYPGKNLGAFGDGGAICVNDDELFSEIKKIRNLGSEFKYEHEIIGRNSRLDTIQACVLDVKLKYLDENNEKRRTIAGWYNKLLTNITNSDKDIVIKIPQIEIGCEPVYHLYMIRLFDEYDDGSESRDSVQDFLKMLGITTLIHYPISIPQQSWYKKYSDTDIDTNICPIATETSQQILSLPMYPELMYDDVKFICEMIYKYHYQN